MSTRSRTARPSVGLVMIVRNEEVTLPRLAASVRSQVDHYTIVDTGSTDATVEVARRAFGELPGDIVVDEWRGFAGSRNVALEAAAPKTDWLLLMDADETLVGRLDRSLLRPDLDALELRRRSGSVRLWLPRLVRSGPPWAWAGRTHEHLCFGEGVPRVSRASSPQVVHHADGGSRSDKYERDLALLSQDWDERPGDARTAFYMARTLEALEDYERAIDWYRLRAGLGGFEEERWYASYRLGACLLSAGLVDEGRAQLWESWAGRPGRAEPLVDLAEHYRTSADWAGAWHACQAAFSSSAARPDGKNRPPEDALFVDVETYAWRLAYEASIAAWYVGEAGAGRRYCQYVLSCPGVPAVVRVAVAKNAKYYTN